jgi:hypothetical protein
MDRPPSRSSHRGRRPGSFNLERVMEAITGGSKQ